MKNSTLNILKAQRWKKRNSNVLIGTTDEKEKNDFLSRLGNIAYAKPKEQVEEDQEYWDPDLFFILPEEYAEENKNTVGIENLQDPVNRKIITRTQEYKHSIVNPLQYNMQLVSDFILSELSPELLGIQAGIEESRAILEHTLGEMDNYPFTVMELVTREVIKLKLTKFITSYCNVGESEVNAIIDRVLVPKQREILVPTPMPTKKDK